MSRRVEREYEKSGISFEVSATPLNNGGNVLALVSVTFNDVLVVRSIRLLDGRNGKWLSFPSYKRNDGEYSDIAFPILADLREAITDEAIDMYERALAKNDEKSPRRR